MVNAQIAKQIRIVRVPRLCARENGANQLELWTCQGYSPGFNKMNLYEIRCNVPFGGKDVRALRVHIRFFLWFSQSQVTLKEESCKCLTALCWYLVCSRQDMRYSTEHYEAHFCCCILFSAVYSRNSPTASIAISSRRVPYSAKT